MSVDAFNIVGTLQAGHFRVDRPVAEGGFAVVYRAEHLAFRAPVALKCLKIPASITPEQRESFLEKFRAEAELLFRLSNITPNVVRPLQVGTLDLPGRFVPFLALEWLEGETLDAVRERRSAEGKPPMGLHKLVKLLTPVARALTIAHRLPGPNGTVAVIHCDLKPDNLFVASTGGADMVKILDFGIAHVKDVTSAIAGRTSGSGGSAAAFTPGYGAPEQWNPELFGQTGPWTDVWGLALSFVELMLGRPVIEGALGAMMACATDPVKRPTPRTLGLTVPDAVERAIASALAVEPQRRTQDIRTFWTEIERGLGLPPSLLAEDARAEPLHSEPPPQMVKSIPPLAPPVPARGDQGVIESPSTSSLPDLLPMMQQQPQQQQQKQQQQQQQQHAHAAEQTFAFQDDSVRRPPLDLEQGLLLQRSRPRPIPRAPIYGPVVREVDATRGVLEKLSGPLKLVGLALFIAIGDQAHTRLTGEVLSLGPARPFWLSAGLIAIAVALAFARLLSSD